MVVLIVSLLVLVAPVSVGAYHTTDHFCEQCIADNCGGGNTGDAVYMSCVSSSCGDKCVGWVTGRFGLADGCTAQCDAMLASCQIASEDSGGQIDEYCTDMAQECFAACEGGLEDAYDVPDEESDVELYDEPYEELDETDS